MTGEALMRPELGLALPPPPTTLCLAPAPPLPEHDAPAAPIGTGSAPSTSGAGRCGSGALGLPADDSSGSATKTGEAEPMMESVSSIAQSVQLTNAIGLEDDASSTFMDATGRPYVDGDRLSWKKQKTTSNSRLDIRYDGDSETPSPENDPLIRPIGRKAQINQLRRGKSSGSRNDNTVMEGFERSKKREETARELKLKECDERIQTLKEERFAWEKRMYERRQRIYERQERLLALQEEMIEREAKRLDWEGRLFDDRIMNMDISALTGQQQQYFMLSRNEIIARRRNSLG